MPSPMHATTEPSDAHRTVAPAAAVEVWVENEHATGWFAGQLREWTHYPSFGWTGWVQYSTHPGDQWNGRFLAEHVRQPTADPTAERG